MASTFNRPGRKQRLLDSASAAQRQNKLKTMSPDLSPTSRKKLSRRFLAKGEATAGSNALFQSLKTSIGPRGR